MGSKSFNVYVKNTKSLPITVSNFTANTSFLANFGVTVSTDFSGATYTGKFFQASMGVSVSTSIDLPALQKNTYSISFTSTSADVYGSFIGSSTTNATISSTSPEMYLGAWTNASTKNVWYKNWFRIPANFSSIMGYSGSTSGCSLHITSACLVLKSSIGSTPTSLTSGFFPKVNIGYDFGYAGNAITSTGTNPTTTALLLARAFSATQNITNVTVPQWLDETTYAMDITDTIKTSFGRKMGVSTTYYSPCVVTWINDGVVPLMISTPSSPFYSTDGGLSSRQFYAYESGIADIPTLKIDLEETSYISNIDTLTIQSGTEEETLFYNSNKFSVGFTQKTFYNRALVKCNLSFIPTTAVVTSASFVFYAPTAAASHTIVGTTSGSMLAYQLYKKWDVYAASWIRRIGTEKWTTAGTETINERSSASIANIPISNTDFGGTKTLKLPASTVQEWITTPEYNYGMILMSDKENTTTANKLIINYNGASLADNTCYFIVYYTLSGTPHTALVYPYSFQIT